MNRQNIYIYIYILLLVITFIWFFVYDISFMIFRLSYIIFYKVFPSWSSRIKHTLFEAGMFLTI